MREERLVYLRRLGAEHRVAAKPLPPRVPGKKGPPPRIVQGEARRYRFSYTKLGPSAFLSHLDLIRALPRAFRRLDLPLYYSSGYHPKPEMGFGPALSLGVASLGEVIDVKVTADFDPAAVAEALSEGAPDGIRFTGGVLLGKEDAAVTRVIDGACYVVAFARSALSERGGEAWLAGEVERFRAASEHKVMRRIDGLGKSVDVRSFVRAIALESAEAREAVARAGLIGDLVALHVAVEIRGNGSVKIGEVVEALAGGELPHRAVRVALGAWRELDGGQCTLVSPLELAALRRGAALASQGEGASAPAAGA
jgi:radical SAM-linked protein